MLASLQKKMSFLFTPSPYPLPQTFSLPRKKEVDRENVYILTPGTVQNVDTSMKPKPQQTFYGESIKRAKPSDTTLTKLFPELVSEISTFFPTMKDAQSMFLTAKDLDLPAANQKYHFRHAIKQFKLKLKRIPQTEREDIYFKNVTNLVIDGSYQEFRDFDARSIIHFSNVENLYITNFRSIIHLESLKILKELKSIHIHVGHTWTLPVDFAAYIFHCLGQIDTLEHIKLSNFEAMSGFVEIDNRNIEVDFSEFKKLPKLKKLHLRLLQPRKHDYLGGFKSIDQLTQLNELNIDTFHFRSEYMDQLIGLKNNLEAFTFTYAGMVERDYTTNISVNVFENFSKLSVLKIETQAFSVRRNSVSTILGLSTLPNCLTHLHIRGYKFGVTDGFDDLQNLTSLTTLKVYHHRSFSLRPLRFLTKLEILNVEQDDTFDPMELINLTEIVELDIGALDSSVKNLDFLRNMKKLKILKITTAYGLRNYSEIKNLKNIEKLHIAGSKFCWDHVDQLGLLWKVKRENLYVTFCNPWEEPNFREKLWKLIENKRMKLKGLK